MTSIDTWRSHVFDVLPPVPPSPSMLFSAESQGTAAPEFTSFSNSRVAVIPAQRVDLDDMLLGLSLPRTLDSADAIAIALAYSSRRSDVLQAEVFIAEQKYQESLIAARCYMLHLSKLKDFIRKVEEDIQRFRGLVANRIPVVNVGVSSSYLAPSGTLHDSVDVTSLDANNLTMPDDGTTLQPHRLGSVRG